MTVASPGSEATLVEFVVDWQLSLVPEDSGTAAAGDQRRTATIDLRALEAAALHR